LVGGGAPPSPPPKPSQFTRNRMGGAVYRVYDKAMIELYYEALAEYEDIPV
jgi:hypothetical protein